MKYVSGQLLADPQRTKALISNQQVLRFQKDRGMQIAGGDGREGMSHNNHTTRKLDNYVVCASNITVR